jgi:hypothetical protein
MKSNAHAALLGVLLTLSKDGRGVCAEDWMNPARPIALHRIKNCLMYRRD